MSESTFFGAWLKRRRNELGLSQKELARAAECSVITIAKLESGERRPSRQVAELLAKCLDVPATERESFVEFARMEWPNGQVAPDELTSSQAPWRALSALRTLRLRESRPNNLPAQRTTFVGRQDLVAEVRSLLLEPQPRLVSLVGPPGVGKTRLSLHAVVDLLEDFHHGIFVVDLTSAQAHDAVLTTLAQALKVREAAGSTSEQNPVLEAVR